MLQPSVLLVEDDAFQRKAAETYLMNPVSYTHLTLPTIYSV